MAQHYDVVIVGAGPAGLFAAQELVSRRYRVALVDKGRPLDARGCPLKGGRSSRCIH